MAGLPASLLFLVLEALPPPLVGEPVALPLGPDEVVLSAAFNDESHGIVSTWSDETRSTRLFLIDGMRVESVVTIPDFRAHARSVSGPAKDGSLLVSLSGTPSSRQTYVMRLVRILRGQVATVWDSATLPPNDSCERADSTARDSDNRFWACTISRSAGQGRELVLRAGRIPGRDATLRDTLFLPLDSAAKGTPGRYPEEPICRIVEADGGKPLLVVLWGQALEIWDLLESKRLQPFRIDGEPIHSIMWDGGSKLLWVKVASSSRRSWQAFGPNQLLSSDGKPTRCEPVAKLPSADDGEFLRMFTTSGMAVFFSTTMTDALGARVEFVEVGKGDRKTIKQFEFPNGLVLAVSPAGNRALFLQMAPKRQKELRLVDISR